MNRLSIMCVAAAMAVPFSASAAVKNYWIQLTGAQEVPANASTASGIATLKVDDVADTISFVVGAMGLQGAFTMSHIHAAPAGVNGPVVFNFGLNADLQGAVEIGGVPLPGSYALLGNDKPLGSLADQINAAPADFYVNLHTNMYPGGEVRGQIGVVPEPGALAMMLAGLGVFGVLRQRRSRG